MLKMKTTFVDRANTNERVFQRANEMCKGECEITPLSEQYQNSKIKSYAKLLCLDSGDPRAEVVFRPGTLLPHDYGKKRVGRSRKNWIVETTELFWKREVITKNPVYAHTKLDLNNLTHLELIQEAAHRIVTNTRPPNQSHPHQYATQHQNIYQNW